HYVRQQFRRQQYSARPEIGPRTPPCARGCCCIRRRALTESNSDPAKCNPHAGALAVMLTESRQARDDLPRASQKPSPLAPVAAFFGLTGRCLLTCWRGRALKGMASAHVVTREVQLQSTRLCRECSLQR